MRRFVLVRASKVRDKSRGRARETDKDRTSGWHPAPKASQNQDLDGYKSDIGWLVSFGEPGEIGGNSETASQPSY